MPGEVDAAANDAADVDAPIDAPVDACVIDPAGERCNGLDDDCDTNVDESFPTLGTPCDGSDTDVCLDDAIVCDGAGSATTCGAAPDDDVERCNGKDDDCDGDTDEDFPTLEAPCDGVDGDQCREGALACIPDGSGVACSDSTPTTVETCNGADDDCDLDVDEDFPTLGASCDGADGDACAEGLVACDPGGGTRCEDFTATIVEACNDNDDDCDLAVDEAFDLAGDVTNCGVCGRSCTNGYGTTACAASTCMPSCSAGANDCDGNPVNGCELRDTNPACAGAAQVGDVDGDSGADTQQFSGFGEAFFRVRLLDSVAGNTPITARVSLVSPPGTNFDLIVTCIACGGASLSSTTTATDVVQIGRTDFTGSDRSYELLIEVRWASSSACGDWTLEIAGNISTTNRTCD